MLIGTSTPPAPCTAIEATTHSQTLGAQIPTRSPAWTPRAISALVARATRAARSVKEMVVSPSSIAAASPKRAADFASMPGRVPNSRSPRVPSIVGSVVG